MKLDCVRQSVFVSPQTVNSAGRTALAQPSTQPNDEREPWREMTSARSNCGSVYSMSDRVTTAWVLISWLP